MINSVEMVNWRAYDKRKIEFRPGINFVMGANGIGKTSILEAIAYGLTGEPSTSKDRTKFLRDPEKLATVLLSFSINRQEYLVERNQSAHRAGEATLRQSGTDKVLASSQKGVTTQIEKLMGVSADFLRRIVYMSEGEVFRFLDKPPGEAIDEQVRQVLGLTQLNEFLQAIELAEKDLKTRAKDIQGVLATLDNLGIGDDIAYTQQFHRLNNQREEIQTQISQLDRTEASRGRALPELKQLMVLIEGANRVIQNDKQKSEVASRFSAVQFADNLSEELEQTLAELHQWQVEQARMDGEGTAFQRVLDLLLPYVNRAETLPCPVCGKPMTRTERDTVIITIRADMERIEHTKQDLAQRVTRATAAEKRLRTQTEGTRDLRNYLVHSSSELIDSEAALPQLLTQTREQLNTLNAQDSGQQTRIIELKRALSDLDNKRAEYLSVRNLLERLRYESISEIRDALVAIEARSLSLRAAANAAQETYSMQRDSDMQAIYRQIAEIWGSFLAEDHLRVKLGEDGMPILERQNGQQFDLSQFSGGEKTALLIILHTIISHHFSQSKFVMIDEPLEHLDAINRRSLIRFLFSAFDNHAFDQAIIATFEESLIRKYMSDEAINVIHV